MSQELRNKIYGIAAAVLTVLVITGVIDAAQQDQAVNLVNLVLDNADALIGLVASVIAFVKSLPSKTVTVDVAKSDVVSLNLADGRTIKAGKHAA